MTEESRYVKKGNLKLKYMPHLLFLSHGIEILEMRHHAQSAE